MVAGGGRSKEGGDGGASGGAPLATGRGEKEERGGNDRRVLHPDKYLGVAWADRPPLPSGLSARLDVTDELLRVRRLHAASELQAFGLHGVRGSCKREELVACCVRRRNEASMLWESNDAS